MVESLWEGRLASCEHIKTYLNFKREEYVPPPSVNGSPVPAGESVIYPLPPLFPQKMGQNPEALRLPVFRAESHSQSAAALPARVRVLYP